MSAFLIALLDFLGWNNKNNNNFGDSLYADYLIFMGEEYIKEEINDIKWELNNIEYVEL